jgi:predicted dehydrogenase
MASSTLTRRGFLRRSVASAAGALAAPHVLTSMALGGPNAAPASERVNMGFIGLGGHGIGRNLRMFLPQKDARIAALCDVDAGHLDRGQRTAYNYLKGHGRGDEGKAMLQTGDFRRIIDHPDVDGVMVSTPDHWHCLISVLAIRAGKDVICEKPTYNIHEGRVLADTVARYGAVFQTSTEDRSIAIYHKMAELVRNRRIGRLKHILVTLPASPGNPGDPTPKPVPKGFDWDLWLGPAPYVPYCPGRVHFMFRYVRDTGAGIIADWGTHLVDTAQWANDTERTGPVEIEGTGVRHMTGLYDTFYKYDVHYRYASGVTLRIKSGGTGIRFEGTDGWIESPSWRKPIQASRPDILARPIGPDEVHLYTNPAGEHRDFLDSVKTRRDPYFPAEVGHRCSSVMHLGNIAMELRRPLRWDPEREVFPDDPQANRLLHRPMRAPWTL